MKSLTAILVEEGLLREAGRRESELPNEELLVQALLSTGRWVQGKFGARLVKESYQHYSPGVTVWFTKNPSRFPGKLGVRLYTDWHWDKDGQPFQVMMDMVVAPGGGISFLGTMKVSSVEDFIAKEATIREWARKNLFDYENRVGPLS